MHWFLDPIVKHYADFGGRASRQQFWMFVLATVVFIFFLGVLSGVSAGRLPLGYVMVVLFVPMIAIAVRRIRDTGHSGLWIIGLLSPNIFIGLVMTAPFVEFVGNIIASLFYPLVLMTLCAVVYPLYLLSQPTQPEAKQYGLSGRS
jgi:uncharacterized membrane protein YhaH (DUF805 family)